MHPGRESGCSKCLSGQRRLALTRLDQHHSSAGQPAGRIGDDSPLHIESVRSPVERHLRLVKASFNAHEDGYAGIQQLAHDANLLFYGSEEAQEGRNAYREKRRPDFGKFPKRP